MGGGGDDSALHKKMQASSNDMNSARIAAAGLVLTSTTPNSLGSLVRLNILEALAAAGEGARLTSGELAQLARPGEPINVKYLERLLRLVSCKQILSEVVTTRADGQVERRFGMEPIGKFFVADAENGSFANWLLWSLSPSVVSTWDSLDEYMVNDTLSAFERAHGGLDMWEYGQRNPEFDATFNKAMAGNSEVYDPAILDAYQGFEEVKLLVDVGGGCASTLSHIIARHPHIKGINFDQPHIIDACPNIPGVKHVGGDFRESVPAGADAIFMKWILHDWEDETCLRILKNCFKALPAHGKVIVVDSFLPDPVCGVFDDGDGLAFQMDVTMLLNLGDNARERTESEVRKLASEAGFQKLNVICKVDYLSVTELRKT